MSTVASQPREGQQVWVIDEVGATFIVATREEALAAYRDEHHRGAEELLVGTLTVPQDGMTWDELADYATGADWKVGW